MTTIIDPDLPIVDAHHHLGYGKPRYELSDLVADVSAGHNIQATVYVECKAGYRQDGPPELYPVGESETVISHIRSAPQAWRMRLCAGIVGFADLRLGPKINAVLDAHLEASEGRLRGIRQLLVHDPDPFFAAPYLAPPDLMEHPGFRAGVTELGRRNVVFDAIAFHPQHEKLFELAKASAGTNFVINHLGSLVGTGPYAARMEMERKRWLEGLKALASLPNVQMKLGGLGMRRYGSRLEPGKTASIDDIIPEWRELIIPVIDIFGPGRCMFETNFPVDRLTCSYVDLWNIFKTITSDYTPDERRQMFAGTAMRAYNLHLPAANAPAGPH